MPRDLSTRFMIWMTLIVIVAIGCNFVLEHRDQQLRAKQALKEKARILTEQFISMREFIAQKQDRINYNSSGDFEFKHLNPAVVGRGVGNIFNKRTDYTLKQTRLNYRNPTNAPDDFEVNALQSFKSNPDMQEYTGEDVIDGKRVFRYMVPLKIRKPCLQCHGNPKDELDIAGYPKEGYEIGDLGGAISLTIPMQSFLMSSKEAALYRLIILAIVTLVILIALRFLVEKVLVDPLDKLREAATYVGEGNLNVNIPDFKGSASEVKELGEQFKKMVQQLRDLYNNLDTKVKLRTIQLRRTNKKLMEQSKELQKTNQELAEANKMKSKFLAQMSHDLRTPLTSITGLTELVLEQLPDGHKQIRDNLEEINENGHHLLRLINNLLDTAKIEAGKYQLNLELVDPFDILNAVERIMVSLAEKKNLELIVEAETNLPLIYCDAEKIRRAILNLVDNAIKFTPSGGRIEVTVVSENETKEIIFKIKDNGIGISKEDQEIIFDSFCQGNDGNFNQNKGAGLGLCMVKELVEMHDGWIDVDSRLGQGSTFMIGLPINQDKGDS